MTVDQLKLAPRELALLVAAMDAYQGPPSEASLKRLQAAIQAYIPNFGVEVVAK